MPRPVFAFAFANDASEGGRRLPALDGEYNALKRVLDDTSAGWTLVESAETSIAGFIDLLQRGDNQGRIALLHFAGHADSTALLMQRADGEPEIANADGIAEFLAQHPGLGFVFLNACSTVGQVRRLLDAGVPAVIATEHDVNDDVATEFSRRFYNELVNGQTLRRAFDSAAAAVRIDDRLRRAALTRAIKRVGGGPRRDPDDWPWKLHVREGNATADQWSFGYVLDDPLFGVATPPPAPLPEKPYRHLLPFCRDDEPIFFGRRRETRELYDAITRGGARRVILLHGVSGAGKSSLLEAGLVPRLECTRSCECRRRDPERTLVGLLASTLGAGEDQTEASGFTAAWADREKRDGRPLTVILDQVEEVLTDASHDGAGELAALVQMLKEVFDQPNSPQGSIVLGFRKEWLADVQNLLENRALAYSAVFLDRLSERGIHEAVRGVASTPRLRDHYKLIIAVDDDELVHDIAGDLVKDAGSAVAPTLQVLLTKMWERTPEASDGSRTFTRQLYAGLLREGRLLSDFVDQQIDVLHAQFSEAESSGLVLDALNMHVNALGDGTISVTNAERAARYGKRHEEVNCILTAACDGRLVATLSADDPPHSVTTRLAHDTLAAYIHVLATQSGKPVQRPSACSRSVHRNGKTIALVTFAQAAATSLAAPKSAPSPRCRRSRSRRARAGVHADTRAGRRHAARKEPGGGCPGSAGATCGPECHHGAFRVGRDLGSHRLEVGTTGEGRGSPDSGRGYRTIRGSAARSASRNSHARQRSTRRRRARRRGSSGDRFARATDPHCGARARHSSRSGHGRGIQPQWNARRDRLGRRHRADFPRERAWKADSARRSQGGD